MRGDEISAPGEQVAPGGRLFYSNRREERVDGFKAGRWIDVVMEVCGNLSPIFAIKNQSHYLTVRMEQECWRCEGRENRVK